MRFFLVLLPLFLLFPSRVFALCVDLDLVNVPSTVTFQGGTGEYEVYDPSEYMQTISFKVMGGASVLTCNYFITLEAGSSGSPSQRKMTRASDAAALNYNAYTTAAKTNILKSKATAGASEVITGSFPLILGLNQENSHSFFWTINPSQIVAAGATRFQDVTLELRLYSGLVLGATVLEDTKTITFRTKAESSVDLSLVNTGGAFNISDTTQTVDFGALVSGASLAYDTMIRSNDGYVVTLQSQNSQKMQHAGIPSGLVPYSLTMNGSAVNLSPGTVVQAAAATGTTPAAGNRLPTVFTVGALTGTEPAGNYEDVITVTVSSY